MPISPCIKPNKRDGTDINSITRPKKWGLGLLPLLEDLTTNRSYWSAFHLNEALEEISSHSGSSYDPEVVGACLRLFREKGFGFE